MLFGIAVTAVLTHLAAVAVGAGAGWWAKAKAFEKKVEADITNKLNNFK